MRQLVCQHIIKYSSSDRRPAAAVFVDLSGFSAMTEQLSRHGDQGAEVLADVMTAVFGPLVEAVYSQGGFVIGYAGDAFTAVFCDEPSTRVCVRHALASAVAMQRHIQAHSRIVTELGDFPISIKSGVGAGEVAWFFLKSATGKQATYCIRGSSVDRAVAAEESAPPGGILLDNSAYKPGYCGNNSVGGVSRFLRSSILPRRGFAM
jgi:class 3 adenylate cyclase